MRDVVNLTLDDLLNDQRVIAIKEYLDKTYGIDEEKIDEDNALIFIKLHNSYFVSISYNQMGLITVGLVTHYYETSSLGATFVSLYTFHFDVDYFKRWIDKHKEILDSILLSQKL